MPRVRLSAGRIALTKLCSISCALLPIDSKNVPAACALIALLIARREFATAISALRQSLEQSPYDLRLMAETRRVGLALYAAGFGKMPERCCAPRSSSNRGIKISPKPMPGAAAAGLCRRRRSRRQDRRNAFGVMPLAKAVLTFTSSTSSEPVICGVRPARSEIRRSTNAR